MKKIFLLLLFTSGATGFINAQELTSKNGTPILPQEKEIGISVDASPFGTFFRNSGSSALSSSYLAGHEQTIAVKYMKNSSTAYRIKFRLGFDYTSQDTLVRDFSSLDANARVTDETKNNKSNIELGFGIQKYRGKGRLRGFYGGEVMVSLASEKTTYTYGNELNSTNYPSPYSQVTEIKKGSNFGFGLRGFLGAEYFLFPKIAIGAQYTYGVNLNFGSRANTTTTVSGTGKPSTSSSTDGAGSSDIGLSGVGISSINLTLHF